MYPRYLDKNIMHFRCYNLGARPVILHIICYMVLKNHVTIHLCGVQFREFNIPEHFEFRKVKCASTPARSNVQLAEPKR